MSDLEIPRDELRRAFEALPAAQRDALATAAARIRVYHEQQKAPDWSIKEPDGTELGQRVTPLDRVGLYVPGGKAAYPSSVLMNAIPAQVAGVREIVMVVPTPDGVRNPLVLAAAHLAGVTRVFTIGGAQAIAALAYGTQTIPRRRQDLRPGQRLCRGGEAARVRHRRHRHGRRRVGDPRDRRCIGESGVGRDRPVLAGGARRARAGVARDARRARCSTRSRARRRPGSAQMPRASIIAASFANRGALIKVRDLDEACAVSNRVAPEHLELAVANPDALLPAIRHAGAIFIGHYASEPLGDYCAGPNHVLPTGRTARFSSPLGVYDFQKRSSLLRISREGARTLGAVAATLAHGEG